MNYTKKLAVALLAVAGLSGCASTQIAQLASGQEMKPVPQAAEKTVSRALPSYGSMGGYRYRRFASAAVTS